MKLFLCYKSLKTLLLVIFLLMAIGCNAAQAEMFKVVHVDDGDTIILSNQKHIRYIGINAPEIEHGEKPSEYYGSEARDFNKKMVLGKKVRLEFDSQKKDKYGRLLAYVYLEDGTLVNLELIKQGCAHVLFVSPNTRRYDRLLNIQRSAIEQHKGMWLKVLAIEKKDCVGTQHSRIFHRPECPFAKQITLQNEMKFKTKKDAFMRGYSPCRRCLP
ncbi:MAG: thermonuclease family protein [Pseudomonadota bacterium]